MLLELFVVLGLVLLCLGVLVSLSERIVSLSLLDITQNGVSIADLLELGQRSGVLPSPVWVVVLGQPQKTIPDLLLSGLLVHLKNLVVVLLGVKVWWWRVVAAEEVASWSHADLIPDHSWLHLISKLLECSHVAMHIYLLYLPICPVYLLCVL